MNRARLRAAATLAFLDEQLAVPVTWPADLADQLRTAPEAAAVQAALEQELRALCAQRDALAADLVIDQRAMKEWERKAVQAVDTGWEEIARQAVSRHEYHKAQAQMLETELIEFENAINSCNALLATLARANSV